MLERIILVSKMPTAGARIGPAFVPCGGIGRTSAAQLTGAWISTGAHCAELIEGPPAGLDGVIAMLPAMRQGQHHRLVLRETIDSRGFGGWHTAYSGEATYVDRQIRGFLVDDFGPLSRDDAARRLSELIVQLVLAQTES
ncbi:hypothetical protein GVO57_07725 [Sphingomonas changnyeongensis]|uniref:BLUF domain-containing protein n=1 Tax=Sphingomonas changnyeongensis TaxID=2698679 RepID=A0A7Z2NWQ4_9SPHN|nr:hypothetical protein [Sphingomonas changnyeongensis]QHL90745.1 hypothetical protein GVO57_07725 [Sphingomonas changnyeongensis]